MNHTLDTLPCVVRARAERKAQQELMAARAQAMWDTFTKDEQTLVRFGMFPAGRMKEAEAAQLDTHQLCCALMDIAAKNGGMRA